MFLSPLVANQFRYQSQSTSVPVEVILCGGWLLQKISPQPREFSLRIFSRVTLCSRAVIRKCLLAGVFLDINRSKTSSQIFLVLIFILRYGRLICALFHLFSEFFFIFFLHSYYIPFLLRFIIYYAQLRCFLTYLHRSFETEHYI